MLILDNNTYDSLQSLFYSTADLYQKTFLSLNATNGPQNVQISNSIFSLSESPVAHQQYMTYALKEASAIDYQNQI